MWRRCSESPWGEPKSRADAACLKPLCGISAVNGWCALIHTVPACSRRDFRIARE
jgi:hypothetical protein